MYWRSETAHAWQNLWAFIHAAIGQGPEKLEEPSDLWAHWRAPDLLFSQTCGLPFRLSLHQTATLIGTLDFGLPDMPAGYYQSVLITRKTDTRPLTILAENCAINGVDSQSGWAALLETTQNQGITPKITTVTGAHRASAIAVSEGKADLAALDAVTFQLLQDHEPDITRTLSIVARSAPTPGLPLITNQPHLARPLLDATTSAITALSQQDRDTLHLRGIVHIPAATYMAVAIPRPPFP